MGKKKLNIFYLAQILFLLSGCSGYRVKHKRNPWLSLGIHHVTIPLFVNKTVFPGLNTAITRRVAEDLGTFTKLHVSTGEDKSADSVLVGIIHGEKDYAKSLVTTERQFLGDDYQSSLGNRRGIYTPRQQSYTVKVDLILIKNPTNFDKKLLKSNLRKFIKANPKIVFRRTLTITQTITRKLWKRDSTDLGGVVNSTQNDGLIRRSYTAVAEEVSRQFKEFVLYAF